MARLECQTEVGMVIVEGHAPDYHLVATLDGDPIPVEQAMEIIDTWRERNDTTRDRNVYLHAPRWKP